MSTNKKNTKEHSYFKDIPSESYEEQNIMYLSKSHLLKDYEIKHEQTMQLNKSEKQNPNLCLDFLTYMSKKFGLNLSHGTSTNFFNNTKELSFEQHLDMMFDDNFFDKAIFRSFVYLVLMRRRSLDYTFNHKMFSFDLRDVQYLGGIELKIFNTANEIPSDIARRMKMSSEAYNLKADDFERQFISLEKQLNAKMNKMSQISHNEDSSEKIESQIKAVEREIYGIKMKIEKLSFDIGKELSVTKIIEAPTPDEITDFIAYFVCYGINISKDIFDAKTQRYDNVNHMYKTSDFEVINRATLDDLYFQDLSQYIWVKAENVFDYYLTQIAPKLRLSLNQINVLFNQLIEKIKNTKDVNIFTFRHHCIFMKNGMIPIDYNNDGTLKYQFIKNADLSQRQIMFEYATDYRTSVTYQPQDMYTFSDNKESIPVTPDYIFGSLGRRGFEDDDDEAKSRANLLMQYTLKILLPFNDIDVIKDTFLYFYNSANSGKSTYMKLMNNIVGNQSTVGLETKDLSTESFGLINVKDMRLVLIDEATNGKSKIETDNIKRISAKERIDTNVKNKAYSGFTPTAEMIFASNPEPSFTDESAGTERRLLAFQLESSYSMESDDNKDLVFIKNDLIHRNDFQSACIKWILEHVNVQMPKPTSVQNDTLALISKEDDVQSFIHERLRPLINEPFFISIDNLYELYKIDNLSKGRRLTNIRNKSNFKNALLKIREGLYQHKKLQYSNIDVLNKVIYIQGLLFDNYVKNISNHEFQNANSRRFIKVLSDRKSQLNLFYQQVLEVVNKAKKLSTVSRSRGVMIAIMPDTDVYRGLSESDLQNLANHQKNHFLNSILTDTNISKIKNNDVKKLPISINNNMSDSFYAYSCDDITDKTPFNDFIKY